MHDRRCWEHASRLIGLAPVAALSSTSSKYFVFDGADPLAWNLRFLNEKELTL